MSEVPHCNLKQTKISMKSNPPDSLASCSATQVSGLSLPILPEKKTIVRPSRMGRRRAMALIGVHVLMIAHFGHWLIAGRTISPIEPSESMYTLNHGHLNAGFLFFAAAIAATTLLGRFVCGWGCHFIAYQDLCAWGLKKIGIKPKPFRSRLLVLAPLALAVYMFIWPTVYRLITGIPFPSISNHLVTKDFWATFPGGMVALLTIVLAGMAIVYFLGAKGFCTYACPYGGFFGVADRIAPGRIRVTDACEHCGHCTAACTSNVRVHAEVALYGMVVDPGCMKCMDCVSVCPNDALYLGFTPAIAATKPRIAKKTRIGSVALSGSRRPVPYDFSLREELLMAGTGLAALFGLRGLYGQIPLLLAMGLAAITGFLGVKLLGMIREANVRLQNLQLKRGGVWTKAGILFTAGVGVWFLFVGHSGSVKFCEWRGSALTRGLALPDDLWSPQTQWWSSAGPAAREDHAAAQRWLSRADRLGFTATTETLTDLAWLNVAEGNLPAALTYLQRIRDRIPKRPEPRRALASLYLKANRPLEAETAYRQAIELDPQFALARVELAVLLVSGGRGEEAAELYREAIQAAPTDSSWSIRLARLYLDGRRFTDAEEAVMDALKRTPGDSELLAMLGVMRLSQGRTDEGKRSLQQAIALNPRLAGAHYDLGMALLAERRIEEAVASLRRAVEESPQTALYHYNLAVATFMAGRPAEAELMIREAIRLNPDDADAKGFLKVVQENLPASAAP